MNMNPILSAVIETAPDDYINSEDGLKYCGKCHTPKEAYFAEQYCFNGIDRHLLSHKPMIITTNIPLSAMQKATNLDDRRIYDRILEVCVPVLFDGENFRKGNATENLKKAVQILNR